MDVMLDNTWKVFYYLVLKGSLEFEKNNILFSNKEGFSMRMSM